MNKVKTMPIVLGIITARSGSKGIPKKNIQSLAGKPLIVWTLEAALNSSSITRVIVSTDDKHIAKISRNCGAEVPFMRPRKLAQDNSPHIDVIIHAIRWLEENENWYSDYIMLLQPTSPLRTEKDIDTSIKLALKWNADSIISVNKAASHPYFVRKITKKGILVDFIERPKGYLPRQSLPEAFQENGAIYLVRRDVILKKKTWYTNRTFPYLMEKERSLDIDTPWDIYLANLIMKNKKQHLNLEKEKKEK